MGQQTCADATTRNTGTHVGPLLIGGRTYRRDGVTNVTPSITGKVGQQLLHQKNHPLRIIKVCAALH